MLIPCRRPLVLVCSLSVFRLFLVRLPFLLVCAAEELPGLVAVCLAACLVLAGSMLLPCRRPLVWFCSLSVFRSCWCVQDLKNTSEVRARFYGGEVVTLTGIFYSEYLDHLAKKIAPKKVVLAFLVFDCIKSLRFNVMFVSGPAGIDIVTSMFCQVVPARKKPAAAPSETPAVAKPAVAKTKKTKPPRRLKGGKASKSPQPKRQSKKAKAKVEPPPEAPDLAPPQKRGKAAAQKRPAAASTPDHVRSFDVTTTQTVALLDASLQYSRSLGWFSGQAWAQTQS